MNGVAEEVPAEGASREWHLTKQRKAGHTLAAPRGEVCFRSSLWLPLPWHLLLPAALHFCPLLCLSIPVPPHPGSPASAVNLIRAPQQGVEPLALGAWEGP